MKNKRKKLLMTLFSSLIIFVPDIYGSDFQVNTIEELKSMEPNKLADNVTVTVRGYYSKNDIEAREYFWKLGNSEEDNGGTTIAHSTVMTGRFKLIHNGVLNVKWFGAKGNNNANDYNAIQAALYVPNNEANSVYFPIGNYKIDKSLHLKEGSDKKKLYGEHKTGSQINSSGTAFKIDIKLTYALEISNLRIKGEDNGNAIEINCQTDFLGTTIFDRLEIYGFKNGIYIHGDPAHMSYGIGWLAVTNTSIRGCYNGIKNENCTITTTRIRDCNIYQNNNKGIASILDDNDGGCGIRLDNVQSALISGCDLESNSLGLYLTNSWGVVLESNYYEANNKGAFVIDNCIDVDISGAMVGKVDMGVFNSSNINLNYLRTYGGRLFCDRNNANVMSKFKNPYYIVNKDKDQKDNIKVTIDQYNISNNNIQTSIENIDLVTFKDLKFKSWKRRPQHTSWAGSDIINTASPIGNKTFRYEGSGSFYTEIYVEENDVLGYAYIGTVIPNKTKIQLDGCGINEEIVISQGGFIKLSIRLKVSQSGTMKLTFNNNDANAGYFDIVGHTLYANYPWESTPPQVVSSFEGHEPLLFDATSNSQNNAGISKCLGRGIILGNKAILTGGYGDEPDSPEGWIKAPVGSMYLNNKGGKGTTLFIKEVGEDNTGWVAK